MDDVTDHPEKAQRRTALVEVISFVAVALLLKEAMDPLSARYAGPVSLLTTIVFLSIYSRAQGRTWSAMGLRALPGTRAKLLVVPQALLIFVAVLVISILVTKGLAAMGFRFMSEPIVGEEERWGDIAGNVRMYLILIGLSWVSAGFGEEMFFRGFLMTRLQDVFRGGRLASVAVVLLPALLFGYVHVYYQGLAGFVNGTVIGIIFGTCFLLYKRNLWPLVLAHGFINSLGFTAEFMGWNI